MQRILLRIVKMSFQKTSIVDPSNNNLPFLHRIQDKKWHSVYGIRQEFLSHDILSARRRGCNTPRAISDILRALLEGQQHECHPLSKSPSLHKSPRLELSKLNILSSSMIFMFYLQWDLRNLINTICMYTEGIISILDSHEIMLSRYKQTPVLINCSHYNLLSWQKIYPPAFWHNVSTILNFTEDVFFCQCRSTLQFPRGVLAEVSSLSIMYCNDYDIVGKQFIDATV